jgi:ribosomal-protein-alanine N-acetyltransferase
VHYRLYEPEDFDALYAIEESCFQPPLRFSRGYMRRLIRRTNAATWVVEDSDLMCGFGVVDWAEETAEVIAYIQTLEVLADVRGKGMGGELLRRMENSAWVSGASVSWLHVDAENAGAIRVYERHGYRLRGKERDYYGRGRAALIYGKPLVGERAMR